jgi:hypothetical protein
MLRALNAVFRAHGVPTVGEHLGQQVAKETTPAA